MYCAHYAEASLRNAATATIRVEEGDDSKRTAGLCTLESS
jgi:hypothetical protein